MRSTPILSLCLTLLVGGVSAAEDAAKQRPHLTPEQKAELVKRHDADGDGKLNEQERAAAREAFGAKREEAIARFKEKHPKAFAHFDTNGDGTLDPAEREAAHKRLAEAKARHDADGDGKLNEQEREAAREAFAAKREEAMTRFKEKHPKAFAHFDVNGDGTLDAKEREAARAKLGERREQGQVKPSEKR